MAAEELSVAKTGQSQPQAAKIASAFTTCSDEPVKLNLNFPDWRVTRILMVSRPLAIIRKRSCLLISRNPCCWRLLLMLELQRATII